MTVQQRDNYRKGTDKLVPYSHKSHVCPGCKVNRSVGRYDEGKLLCKSCRGKE